MTVADTITAALAREFPISARLLARGPAFRSAVDEALVVMTADELLRRVVEGGGLAGARNPYGVIIGRIRQAVDGALAVLVEEAVVARVVAQGPLTGARNPHAVVVVARLRQLPVRGETRHQLADERVPALIDGRPWYEALAVSKTADRSCVDREPAWIDREPVDDGVDWDALRGCG